VRLGRPWRIRIAVSSGIVVALAAAVAGGLLAAAAVSADEAAANLPSAPVRTTPTLQAAAQYRGFLPDPAIAAPPVDAAPSAHAARHRTAPDRAPISALAANGIPITALTAYQQAAAREALRRPACGLGWPLLAGIGRVESDHGRFAGAVLHADGVSSPRIIGIALNGVGTALIRDTDDGRLDGDTTYDRAVGPMQFIPSTWMSWGVDADHDGAKNPFDIFDAAAAAADYLCAAGRDLTTSSGQVQAILSYNHSLSYVSTVMALEQVYARDVGITVPIVAATPDKPRPPKLPPVDPGPPLGRHDTSPTTESTAPAGASSTRTPVVSPSAPPTASTASSAPACPSASTTSSASADPSSSGAPTTPAPASTTPETASSMADAAASGSPTALAC
jgi:membrane-bound lytic murein transglycosylase B